MSPYSASSVIKSLKLLERVPTVESTDMVSSAKACIGVTRRPVQLLDIDPKFFQFQYSDDLI